MRLIPHLAKLGRRLQQERESALKELAPVRDHVGHIKRIVAAQQSYAKVSGVKESTSLTAMAEQALQFVSNGFERRGIRCERDFESLPEVSATRRMPSRPGTAARG